MRTKKNIVVLGGSFAPITKAHMNLILASCKHLNARGILVPSSDDYVLRKLRRKKTPHAEFYASYNECRSPALHAILQEMDPEREYIEISHYELKQGKNSGHTLETLDYLSTRYKDSQIYFIMGAEKLKTFRKWKTADELLFHYPIVVAAGQGKEPEDEINTWFPEQKDRFVILTAFEDMDNISSTDVRTFVGFDYYTGVAHFTCKQTADFLKDHFNMR